MRAFHCSFIAPAETAIFPAHVDALAILLSAQFDAPCYNIGVRRHVPQVMCLCERGGSPT